MRTRVAGETGARGLEVGSTATQERQRQRNRQETDRRTDGRTDRQTEGRDGGTRAAPSELARLTVARRSQTGASILACRGSA